MPSDRNMISRVRKLVFRETASLLHNLVSKKWPDNFIKSFADSERYFSSRAEHFRVALCGLFQAGKSLTANMIAGGRDVSRASRFSGIRTSTCNMYLYYSEEENARIFFMSDEELCATLSSLLGVELDTASIWDISASKIIERAFVQLWNSKTNYEHLEYPALIISWMHLLHSMSANRTSIITDINDVLDTCGAPEDERVRWDEIRRAYPTINSFNAFVVKVRTEFPIQEVKYIFIKKILAGINSDWMKDNNMSIVDSPGLSVNEQDTKTAEEALMNADAVIYVFGGNKNFKEPSETERAFIANLKAKTKGCPVIFAVNWPEKPKPAILSSIQSIINMSGYDGAMLVSYNALLSYRAVQGEKLLAGELDSRTTAKMIEQAGEEASSPQEAWTLLAYDEIYSFSRAEAQEILHKGLCIESISTVRKYSGYGNFISALNEIVRGNDILQSQVFMPVSTKLKRLNDELATLERSVKQSWELRQIKLQILCEKKKSEFRSYVNDRWCVSVAQEMMSQIKRIIPDLAYIIADLFTEPESIDFQQKCSQLLDKAFSDWHKKFIDKGTGTSSSVLYQCEQFFTRNNADDEVLSQIWQESSKNKGRLWNAVLYEIKTNPAPIHGLSDFVDKYLDPLIKKGAATAVDHVGNYISAKTSWNPFVDHKKKMLEAWAKMKVDVESTLYSAYYSFESSAVSELARSLHGEPQKIYAVVEKWIEGIIKAAGQSAIRMKERELDRLSSCQERITKHCQKLSSYIYESQ